MIKKLLLIILLFLSQNLLYAADNKIPIHIVRIIDGDTVVASLTNSRYKSFKIRLYGIDCYEISRNKRAYKQAYKHYISLYRVIWNGRLAYKVLYNSVKGKHIYCDFKGLDIYGRKLGILYDENGTNINKLLLNTPYCFPY